MPSFTLAAVAGLSLLASCTATLRGLSPIPPLEVGIPPLGRCDGNNRTDCGYYGINEQQCESKGCCWVPAEARSQRAIFADAPEFDIPWCFYQSPASPSCSTSPPCSGHGSCTDGACQCSAGYATCGAIGSSDCSTDTNTDANNCGACGTVCATGHGVQSSTCGSGKCDITCEPGYTLCFGECAAGPNCNSTAPFSPSDMATMETYFLANININGEGGVVAGPSHSAPDYYYAWQRDAGLSMRELQNIRSISNVSSQLQSYVKWVSANQFAPDPNGEDIRGEPKFYLPDPAKSYDKGWMRPQNDGPAVRTIALVYYAQQLLKAGEKDYVTSHIYTADATVPGIKRDLEYVTQVWSQDSGDPWEEVRGQVFFDKFMMRAAFIDAAALADVLGDSSSASEWRNTASQIESNIVSVHWNGSLIMEVPQTRELDSAVHLGFIHGYRGDNFLGPSDEKVQSSIATLVNAFAGYQDFSINAKDSAAGIPGLLVGRYLFDTYNGGNSAQPGSGNAWILCTAGLAQAYYQAASAHSDLGSIEITDLNQLYWQQVVELSSYARPSTDLADDELLAALRPGATISLDTDRSTFMSLVNGLTLTGDGILRRIKYHVQPYGFHLTEQINKDNGDPQGCPDLTWSYAEVFGAMGAREKASAAVAAL